MDVPDKHIVVFALLRDNHILLEKRLSGALKDQWIFPGGGVEDGEEFEAAFLREVQEELGVTPQVYKQLQTDEIIRGVNNIIINIFLVEQWEGELPEAILDDENNPLQWMNLDELVNSPAEPVLKVARVVKEHISLNE